MRRHPYRDPELPPVEPPTRRVPVDDLALTIIVGTLGIVIGITADRATELSFGLLFVAIAALIMGAARRAS